ncbi:MAG TPA: hypothetical protein ENH10_07120 [Bacteroidetes bacterium]|nr:hypothetical protein [Bacteroidota bacterium]HEX04912.1 hypothetical protein [Bacteroidota bacterium]
MPTPKSDNRPKERICSVCGKDKAARHYSHYASTPTCVACRIILDTQEHEARKAERRLERAAEKQAKEERAAKKITDARLAKRVEKEAAREEKDAVDAQEEAQRELASRALSSKRLLPFIMRFHSKYIPGWVHKDICARLEKFSQDVIDGKEPRLMLFMPPRHGKQISHSQQVLTTSGWATHGELSAGDEVFSPSGKVIKVLALSAETEATLEVEFSNGEKVKCHPNHEWTVFDRGSNEWKTVETKYFVRSTKFGKQVDLMPAGRSTYQLPEVAALEMPEQLERKKIKRFAAQRRIGIVSVRDCSPELGRCIQVDSEDGLYLVGKSLIPTHNSEIASINFPAWHMGRCPDHDVIATSYAATLTMSFSKKIRGLLRDDAYSVVFPRTKLDPENQSAETWSTTEGGTYVAAGVGGGITGKGAHILIIDDPVKNRDEADSDTAQQGTWDWYTSTAYTRLAPGAGVLVIQCMVGDTSVVMSGGSHKRLKDIKIGDSVATYDKGAIKASRVLNWKNQGPDYVFAIRMSSGIAVRANERHPFLVRREGRLEWVRLRDLKVGDTIQRAIEVSGGGSSSKRPNTYDVVPDCIAEIAPDGVEEVFDIQVEGTENFIANGLISHNTRWNEADLSGRLIEQMEEGEGDNWEIVDYPAIALEDEKYRKMGEALHPARYPESALKRIRRAVGERDWWALFQQKPTAQDGTYFTRNMFKYYDGPAPGRLNVYQAWDLAIGKREHNDWTVGVTVGIDEDDKMYVLDMVRGRWDSMEIIENMLNSYEKWRPLLVGIEEGHIRMAIGPFLEKRIKERKLTGMAIQKLPPGRRDKESRARPLQGRMQQGMVLWPKHAVWLDTAVAEMLGFASGGKFDDIVDAFAWIGLMLSEIVPHNKRRVKKRKSWRDRLKTMGRNMRNPMAA